GRCQHKHTIPDPAQNEAITDKHFFMKGTKPVPTLIAFPHEKDLLKEHPNNAMPYRFYIPKIWEAARCFMGRAEEISIIGYSCTDSFRNGAGPEFGQLQVCGLSTAESDGHWQKYLRGGPDRPGVSRLQRRPPARSRQIADGKNAAQRRLYRLEPDRRAHSGRP